MTPTRPALIALAALAVPTVAEAQHVTADIGIRQYPIEAHIVIGQPYFYAPRPHYHPVYRVVPVYRVHPGYRWYRHHQYRVARLWYDGDRGRYYDRHDPHVRGLREVVVYERNGRYYRDD